MAKKSSIHFLNKGFLSILVAKTKSHSVRQEIFIFYIEATRVWKPTQIAKIKMVRIITNVGTSNVLHCVLYLNKNQPLSRTEMSQLIRVSHFYNYWWPYFRITCDLFGNFNHYNFIIKSILFKSFYWKNKQQVKIL